MRRHLSRVVCNFSWGDRVLTVDLSSVENISGTIKYTFSEDGFSVEKVELNYSRSHEYPNEIVQYTGNHYPYFETNGWHDYETTFYSFRTCGENLEQSTTSISDFVNYVDDLKADIDGIDYTAWCAFNSIYLRLNFTN